MRLDDYGVAWELTDDELCPACGQPDNCGDCNHQPLSPKEIAILKGKR